MGSLSLPLLLLASIWGLFTPVLRAVEMMNERRDKILDSQSNLTAAHRRLLLYSDWLTIFLLAYSFVAFVGVLIYFSPDFVDLGQGAQRERTILVYKITGAIFFGISAVGLLSGFFDFRALRTFVNNFDDSTIRTAPPQRPRPPSS